MKRLRSRALNGETLFGCVLNLGSSISSEMVGQAGFDWVLIDLEHGAGGEGELVSQLQAVQHTPAAAIVRVESTERQRINRALDLGADGIMVPRIDTCEQAQAVSAALQFPPNGTRGVAKMNRAYGFGPHFKSYLEHARENLLSMVQIESDTSLRNLEEIASTPGIDVVFVGSSDLSYSMGIPFDLQHPRFQSALKQVAEAARHYGKIAGIKIGDSEELERYLELGYRFIACGSDGDLLFQNACKLASKLRKDRGGHGGLQPHNNFGSIRV